MASWRSPTDARNPDRFPDWIRALRGESGVYAIRDAETREILYVGESHTGRLYATLTRHLQRWQGFNHGFAYDRDAVQVRVEISDPDETMMIQQDWIERLEPRDNRERYLEPDDAEEDADVPF